jgi:hypothetical protein
LFLGTLKMMAIRDRNASHETEIQKALATPRYRNGWKDTGYAERTTSQAIEASRRSHKTLPSPLAVHIQFNELHTHQLLERYKNIVLLAEAARQGTASDPIAIPRHDPNADLFCLAGYPQLAGQVHQGFTQELREIQRLEESFQQIYGYVRAWPPASRPVPDSMADARRGFAEIDRRRGCTRSTLLARWSSGPSCTTTSTTSKPPCSTFSVSEIVVGRVCRTRRLISLSCRVTQV